MELKKLILGNHDSYPLQRYLPHFNKVYGSYEYDNFILTHIPVHPNQIGRYEGNIHGHMHTHKVRIGCLDDPDPRYFCVSAEQINLTPVELNTIINKMRGN